MIKKKIQKLSKSERIQQFLTKYNIPKMYLSNSRDMVSKGVLIGLFIALIPMPMQMLFVILTMKFLKFNLPVAILLCWITNPFTMPFIYYIEYIIGSFLLNIDMVTIQMTLEWFNQNFQNIFIPLYFGAFVLATCVSITMYFLINVLWIFFVKKSKKIHYTKRKY